MNQEKQNRVTIIDARTGAARLSEPVMHQTPKTHEPVAPAEASGAPAEEAAALPQTAEVVAAVKGDEKKKAAPKPKPDIETLEQFIEHAYAQKGKRVALRDKVERAISQGATLTPEANLRLLELARADRLLQVPVQIFLTALEVQGYPALKGALKAFAREAIAQHAVFGDAQMQATLHNQPTALPIRLAVERIAQFKAQWLPDAEGQPAKDAELRTLKRSATLTFLLILIEVKGLSVAEAMDGLAQHLWLPAASELAADAEKIRAAAGIDSDEGAGVIARVFRQAKIDAEALAAQAGTRAMALQVEVNGLQAQLAEATAQLQTAQDALALEIAAHGQTRAVLTQQLETEGTHLRQDLETLRADVCRRLTEDIGFLQTGLEAVTGAEPRYRVLIDRVERVLVTLGRQLKAVERDEQ